MTSATSGIVDFHSHHVPPHWTLTTLANFAPSQRARWERINRRLADPGALLEAIESGDIAARIVNIPTALFSHPGETLAADVFQRVNDQIAELVASHPQHLHGIATVDAFSGCPMPSQSLTISMPTWSRGTKNICGRAASPSPRVATNGIHCANIAPVD